MLGKINKQTKKIVAFVLIVTMVFGVGNSYGLLSGKPETNVAQAAVTAITSMDYYDSANGTNGEWKKIDDVPYFIYNSTWGWEHQQWSDDADGWIYMGSKFWNLHGWFRWILVLKHRLVVYSSFS